MEKVFSMIFKYFFSFSAIGIPSISLEYGSGVVGGDLGILVKVVASGQTCIRGTVTCWCMFVETGFI